MSDLEVDSIEQLLAIALSAERSAATRYTEISEHMLNSGNPELAELFASIAGSEREHAKEVEKIIQTLGIQDLPEAPTIAWQHPQVRDDRDRATTPGTSTPYLALAYAVNNEELAFRFYSYVAANAKKEDIRRFAEVFAKEELAHAELFREQRRRAFHEQRSKDRENAIPPPGEIHTVAELLAAAINIERQIRNLLAVAANLEVDVSDSIATSDALIEQLELDLTLLPPEPLCSPIAAENDAVEDIAFAGTDEVRQALARAAERAFMFYDSVTESARDEDVMFKAQELTGVALDRINSLGSLGDG